MLLGIDLGTSSVKVSVVEAQTGRLVASAHFPENEAEIIVPQHGWAEQSPDQWWEYVKQAILKCHSTGTYDTKGIKAIGIAYQMHGLVITDKDQRSIRNSIIWCDSRAVDIGNKAFEEIGEDVCLSHLLNSPGNFTASKLAWVKENEPSIYSRAYKIMLPGDYISMIMTGECTTTVSALSEGIFWDFRNNSISNEVMDYFGFSNSLIPDVKELFSPHGSLKSSIAVQLDLPAGIPVSYKAGDQPNNALSLNVMHPGEVAATAGTSGVIYGIGDTLDYDSQSRINSFAHVNHQPANKRIGILLCINGAGIFNRWIRNIAGSGLSYAALNEAARGIKPGANGLLALPFGNGAERMLNNRTIGAHFINLDMNVHTIGHIVRAAQEGIAFAFRYGFDIMNENGIRPSVIRAGKSNLFLSEVFTEAFTAVTQTSLEFYEGDGSYGAAIGAGIGCGIYKDASDAFSGRKQVQTVQPKNTNTYEDLYFEWRSHLELQLQKQEEHSTIEKELMAFHNKQ